MKTFLYIEDIPSNRSDVLDSLKGLKILNLTRYCWEHPDREISEYGIEAKDVFSLAPGLLIMCFYSGLVIGYGSQPSKNSVTIWIEKNEAGETIEELTEEDKELYPVDARDAVYSNNFWARFVGQRISNITILKRSYSSALYADIANEIGLLFEVENGSRFIASHGLHDDSDDFSVIQESQIDNEIRNQIQGL
ncbi:hypothetical protein CDG76_08840 [Nostoc sp. 'Peltigera membranacea cyanobiont' 210A]|uniref:hypothetical protein n=1 Tax=Nostoc sp. 'Peltigera membranacea cyanobiont' 210A TaxID=2014529 RepID=UPI000B958C4A|nr:hypothetical protein [Nostoc sp. 'Peltigera membranacea cyanobiont' 210A]OYD96855.1 hypothetical protein CDG76_08840 [Nostoc sp. 'Peltigera membranacea cyanobiont' 210A]